MKSKFTSPWSKQIKVSPEENVTMCFVIPSPQLFQDSQTHNLADAGTQSIKIKSVYLIFRPNIQFQGRRSTLEASVACLGLTSLAAEGSQRGNCNLQESSSC